jgi:hypothetical protein
MLALLAASVLLTAASVAGYEYVRTQIQSGDLSVQRLAPAAVVRLPITRPTHALAVENTFGNGAVSVVVLSARDRAPVSEPVELVFQQGRLGNQRVPLDIADLPPGDYLLSARLAGGESGRAGYALIQGYAALVPIAAALVGIGVGSALALVILLLGVIAEQRLSDRSDRL